MIDTKLVGADGKQTQEVDTFGAALVTKRPIPPYVGFNGEQKMRVFRQFLQTSAGSSDMLVNGSSTNVDFFVEADDDKDLYITRLSFLVADAGATLDKFGNLSALTNGCQLEYIDESGTVSINSAIKTNFQLYRVCGNIPQIFNNVVGSNIDAVLPDMDIRKVFGFEWGLLLKQGTSQRLTFRIRDNLSTGMSEMNCVSYGFTREAD